MTDMIRVRKCAICTTLSLWPAAFSGDLASRWQAFSEGPGALESRYQADYDEDDLIPDLVELEDLALRMHYAAREIAASRAEIDQRVEGLPALRGAADPAVRGFWQHADEAGGGGGGGGEGGGEVDEGVEGLPALRGAADPAVRAFWKHADEAVESMKAGGGNAYEVDWRQVEQKTIRECLERGQSLDSIADALGSNSPGAASPGQQAALRERIAGIEAERLRAGQQGLAK